MSTFALGLFCFQACLVQDVLSQCIGALPAPIAAPCGGSFGGPIGIGWADFAGPIAGPSACSSGGYGGSGIGEVAVTGELPVTGTTLVSGQVPILGAVEFGGPVAASGCVSIAGSCACGCAGPYGAGPYSTGYIY